MPRANPNDYKVYNRTRRPKRSYESRGRIKGVLTKTVLQGVIEDILDIPRNQGKGPGAKILNTIFTTMVSALRQKKSVRIRGLGTFQTYTRPPIKKQHNLFINRVAFPYPHVFPAKTLVRFIPHADLRTP